MRVPPLFVAVLVAAALFVAFLALRPAAVPLEPLRPGEKVIVVPATGDSQVPFMSETEPIGSVGLGDIYEVDETHGDRVWVPQLRGYLRRADLLPYDTAVDTLTDRLRTDLSSHNYTVRGLLWYVKGESDIARGDYDEAIRLDPKNADSFNGRGIVWEAKGEHDKAIRDYGEAIRLHPKDATAFNNRGTVWKAKGEYDKAIRDYGEAIRLDPKSAAAFDNRAWLRATCPDASYRDGPAAVIDATVACELSGWKSVRSLIMLAVAYAEAGDFAMAALFCRKAIGVDPADNDATPTALLELFTAGKPYREEPKAAP